MKPTALSTLIRAADLERFLEGVGNKDLFSAIKIICERAGVEPPSPNDDISPSLDRIWRDIKRKHILPK